MATWGHGNALHKAIGGLLLISTASWHHQELPICLCPPSPAPQPSSLSPVPPAWLRRKQPCSKAEDKSGLSSSTAAVRTWPTGRQGIVWAQLFGKINERCWDRSHNRPVDIHYGLDALFPEDGASHEGQVSASVVKERELGRRPELCGETSRKVNALLCVKKNPPFFSQQKIFNSLKIKLVADLIPNALCLTWKRFQQCFDLHPKSTGNSTNCSSRPKPRKERIPTLKKKKKYPCC